MKTINPIKENMEQKTTIQINVEEKKKLDDYKISKYEPYWLVIKRLLKTKGEPSSVKNQGEASHSGEEKK